MKTEKSSWSEQATENINLRVRQSVKDSIASAAAKDHRSVSGYMLALHYRNIGMTEAQIVEEEANRPANEKEEKSF